MSSKKIAEHKNLLVVRRQTKRPIHVPSESDPSPDWMPLLIIPHTIVFPHNTLALSSLYGLTSRDLQIAQSGDLRVVIATRINDEKDAVPHVADIATEATINGLLSFHGGGIGVVVKGLHRVILDEYLFIQEGCYVAVHELTEVKPQRTDELLAGIIAVKEMIEKLSKLSPAMSNEIAALVYTTHDPSMLCDLVAQHLSLTVQEKLSFLGNLDPVDRVQKLLKLLTREVDLLSLSTKIQEEVKTDFNAHVRKNFLREQMAAIKRELGESTSGGGDDHQSMEKILKKLPLTKQARQVVDRELDRLENMASGSPEYAVSWNYLHWIKDLPWKDTKTAMLSLERAQTMLDKNHFGMEKVKDRILDFLAVLAHGASHKGQIMLLVGPPGVGKTSIGRSIAEALKRPFVKIALGGVKDEAEIRGHRRTYIGAMPGKIMSAMKEAGVKHPVILLDEVDKVGVSHTHDLSSALLEVLDPEQNQHFTDHYLGVEFDLSQVLFIATANHLRDIPRPLLDRMEALEVSGYTEQEKIQIALQHLVPTLRKSFHLKTAQLGFTAPVVQHLVRYYTREAGVRQLQRDLRQMAQKVIRSLVGSKSSKPKSVPLDVAHVQKYLGRPRFLDEPKDLVLPPGVAVGLAYTSVGGDILYIESRLGVQGRRPEGSQGGSGVGRLLLTGSLGQVMQESAQTALSFIQSRHTLLGLAPELVEQSHIHMHLPDGATPKDGPSAGVAIMCALASLFLDKPLPHGLSMTGEITLRGQVLAIGGVKEKLLAAHRYGKRMIILPKANWNDLEDLPADVLADFELYPVEWMEDALRIARLIEAEVPVTPSVFVKLES